MSNIKQAVDAAIKALSEFFPGQPFIGLELEEVIPAEDTWPAPKVLIGLKSVLPLGDIV